jgi:hypothetical protein
MILSGQTHLCLCVLVDEIANLDDGKVIHLVIRPLDAPQNPMNGKEEE